MFTFYLLDQNFTTQFLRNFSHFQYSCYRPVAYRTVYILSCLSENSPFAVCKVSPFIHFYMDGLVLRIGIWQVHFIVFFMWWIRDFQEGEFIPCNTAQLIAKCPPNAFCFLVKESKNKNISNLFF